MTSNLPRTSAEIQEAAVTFDLSPYREEFYSFQEDKVKYEHAKKLWEIRRDRFKNMAGKANQFVLDNIVVATHAISGAFNKAKFAKEQPHLYDKYLVKVEMEVFDEEAFAKDHPTLYHGDEYRARALRFKI